MIPAALCFGNRSSRNTKDYKRRGLINQTPTSHNHFILKNAYVFFALASAISSPQFKRPVNCIRTNSVRMDSMVMESPVIPSRKKAAENSTRYMNWEMPIYRRANLIQITSLMYDITRPMDTAEQIIKAAARFIWSTR